MIRFRSLGTAGALAGVLACIAATAGQAPEAMPPVDRQGIFDAFGWQPDAIEVSTQTIAPGFHVLFGMGGNIAASIGPQGTLLVDDQFPEIRDDLDVALSRLGSISVDFIVNTHWHFDHADGNMSYGPDGTWLVSQANARAGMAKGGLVDLVSVVYDQKPYPADALPVITFDDHMSFHFNGEQIDLLHAGPAHTTGDTAVIFRGRNAVHLGDVFNNAGWPFIDTGSGGDLDGMIAFCTAVLAEIDDETAVIPGHGPVTNRAELKRYVELLSIARDRISALIAAGASLEEVMAARPTADLDGEMGDPVRFVNRAYMSLTRAVDD
ncbi:MAG: MBL fold metallo-hydrolase [Pseudomonadales bacterium]|jgi:glyoxylase-like metal-dependent hydrolase (beta-lactamase superfamily II)|nr:MBL fold metallo-hydrolase [Pseudomonadales bacterium]